MWIQLRTIYYIEVNGKTVTLHPGDWTDKLGKQEAFRLIASGQAWIPDIKKLNGLIDNTAGIVLLGNDSALRDKLSKSLNIDVIESDIPILPFSENLILNVDAKLRLELIPVGFKLLQNWQMAVPLLSYEFLAIHTGTEAEQEETKAVIHELRVPLKNVDILFIRRCPETTELIEKWSEDLEQGKNKYLSFLKHFYIIKPVCCDLPVNWTNEKSPN